jgi:hypothetical protein
MNLVQLMYCGERRLANAVLPTVRFGVHRAEIVSRQKTSKTLLSRHLSLSASDIPNGKLYREVGHEFFEEITQLS